MSTPTPLHLLLLRPARCLALFSGSQCLIRPGLGGVGRAIIPSLSSWNCQAWVQKAALPPLGWWPSRPACALSSGSWAEAWGERWLCSLQFLYSVTWGGRLPLPGPQSPHLCRSGQLLSLKPTACCSILLADVSKCFTSVVTT